MCPVWIVLSTLIIIDCCRIVFRYPTADIHFSFICSTFFGIMGFISCVLLLVRSRRSFVGLAVLWAVGPLASGVLIPACPLFYLYGMTRTTFARVRCCLLCLCFEGAGQKQFYFTFVLALPLYSPLVLLQEVVYLYVIMHRVSPLRVFCVFVLFNMCLPRQYFFLRF